MKRFRTVISAVALGLLMQGGLVAAAPTQTGQGIMVNFTGSNNYALVQNKLYSFNITAAATYFTNAYDGLGPVVSCTGGGCPGTALTAFRATLASRAC